MELRLLLAVSLFMGLGLTGCHASRDLSSGAIRLTMADVAPDPAGMQGEQFARKSIPIGHGISADAHIEFTAKGNGHLSVAGLIVRVYDDHDDGRVFEPRLLNIVFVDVTGDSYTDLIISGAEVLTEDSDSSDGRTEVFACFVYEPSSGTFVRGYAQGPDIVVAG
jgi:hypothetical protein